MINQCGYFIWKSFLLLFISNAKNSDWLAHSMYSANNFYFKSIWLNKWQSNKVPTENKISDEIEP